ncbi:MAG: branched-chain amino acid ABC transporter permease [Alphaproteobacteria bacterium]|nr:branched-chain amino acid ABC transporter permease [Alphaproteobacteria bacterium]
MASRHRGLVLLAAVVLALPWFLANKFHFQVAILIGLNALVCVGLNLLIGYAGQISLGHAAFFGLGAYVPALLVDKLRWDSSLALAAGLAAVGLLAFAVARPILRLKGHYLAMATLGLGIIVAIVINRELDLTGGPDGMSVRAYRIGDLRLRGEWTWYWITGGTLVLGVWLAQNLIDSPAGRALRALHGSEVAAESLGIDVAGFKVKAFVISALYAGLAGAMTAHFLQFVTPIEAGFLRSIEFVTMVVLGGMASTLGVVVGAAILTLLPQLLTGFHDYEHLVLGAILMGMMIFLPKGLVPSLAALWTRWRAQS